MRWWTDFPSSGTPLDFCLVVPGRRRGRGLGAAAARRAARGAPGGAVAQAHEHVFPPALVGVSLNGPSIGHQEHWRGSVGGATGTERRRVPTLAGVPPRLGQTYVGCICAGSSSCWMACPTPFRVTIPSGAVGDTHCFALDGNREVPRIKVPGASLVPRRGS